MYLPKMDQQTMPIVDDGTQSAYGDGNDVDSTFATDDGTNEIEEVRHESRWDTIKVRIWRILLTASLLITACAVTWITYRSLDDEQNDNFETAFEQFSRTIGDAAVDQQEALHLAYYGFADTISSQTDGSGKEWPFVSIPFFNKNAATVLKESRSEGLLLSHVVKSEQREAWENWTIHHHIDLVEEAHMLEDGNLDDLNPVGFHPFISQFARNGSFIPDKERSMHFPVWEYAPAPFTFGFINWNALNDQTRINALFKLSDELLYSDIDAYYDASLGVAFTEEEHEAMHSQLGDSDVSHPHSYFILPVHEKVGNTSSEIVAILSGAVAWDASLNKLLPDGVEGIITVVKNTCNQSFTYEIIGADAVFLGNGDKHDTKYDKFEKSVTLSQPRNKTRLANEPGHCMYTMHIYPSQRFEDKYDTFTPERFGIIVMATFVFVIAVFFVYDLFVYKRNENLVENVARSNAIVSSLFPKNIRRRLLEQEAIARNSAGGDGKTAANKRIANLKNYLSGHTSEDSANEKPLADLFLETTILFADIAGFTAWSSVREPSQVFTLLEKIFSSFDQVAKARRVFKVETVGDCYVAATGIPDPRRDHAVMMVRFARDILSRTRELTKQLEITHGPDTADLSLRIGIHSGPVTAGVLRGERARFQLFGDTMNTASRIEQTGEVGRIHVSSETAEYLKASGEGAWLLKREHTVEAKGKGKMQTYWIRSSKRSSDEESVTSEGTISEINIHLTGGDGKTSGHGKHAQGAAGTDSKAMINYREKTSRLVEWNVEMLLHIIRHIVARREATQQQPLSPKSSQSLLSRNKNSSHGQESTAVVDNFDSNHLHPLDEVEEIIHLPAYDQQVGRMEMDPEHVTIDLTIVNQLRSFVSNIAMMYRDNAFHNFEHASHVTMSVVKLLARIVAPTDLDEIKQATQHSTATNDDNGNDGDGDRSDNRDVAATLHDHTYGITSDPLTQLACAFSAMIHDVDHAGIPNAQLVKENTRIAKIYNNRSVAEQNSLALSWELFVSDEYRDLRACICATPTELKRFRQLVVNGVMATDIVDKELKQLRNNRWDKAFDKVHHESVKDATNRRATIVIEHLIQASDVAHTMQHWHVYRKWNQRFLQECYAAYKAGRAESNPLDGWYEGELGFFDFYIIPLAKKLKDCGVFGKSSDEYLNYARANRKEWEYRGKEVVAEAKRLMEQEAAAEEEQGLEGMAAVTEE